MNETQYLITSTFCLIAFVSAIAPVCDNLKCFLVRQVWEQNPCVYLHWHVIILKKQRKSCSFHYIIPFACAWTNIQPLFSLILTDLTDEQPYIEMQELGQITASWKHSQCLKWCMWDSLTSAKHLKWLVLLSQRRQWERIITRVINLSTHGFCWLLWE